MVKEREKKDLPRNHEKIVCLKNHSTRDALFKSHRGEQFACPVPQSRAVIYLKKTAMHANAFGVGFEE